MAEEYFAGLHRALDVVAREKRFLAFLQAPPIEESLAFYRHIVDNDLCQFVATRRRTSGRLVRRAADPR